MFILSIVFFHDLYHTMTFSLHKQAANSSKTEIWTEPSTIVWCQSVVQHATHRWRICCAEAFPCKMVRMALENGPSGNLNKKQK